MGAQDDRRVAVDRQSRDEPPRRVAGEVAAVRKRLDITGERYGRLVALAFVGIHASNGQSIWRFQCDCGGITETRATFVRSGITTSCGCARKEAAVRNGVQFRKVVARNRLAGRTALRRTFADEYEDYGS